MCFTSCTVCPLLTGIVQVRKAPQQRQKRQIAEVSRPEELETIVESEKQETDRYRFYNAGTHRRE